MNFVNLMTREIRDDLAHRIYSLYDVEAYVATFLQERGVEVDVGTEAQRIAPIVFDRLATEGYLDGDVLRREEVPA